jgi:hypothetical protein
VEGTGQYVFTVPSTPPFTPASVSARDATIIDEQAAIDAIDGTIGGGLGEYYVRIPVPTSDKSGRTVIHAINIVRQQHSVTSANIDVPGGASPDEVRPTLLALCRKDQTTRA